MLPRINWHLQLFIQTWDHHPLSSEGNRSPQQLWVAGQLLHVLQTPEQVIYVIQNMSDNITDKLRDFKYNGYFYTLWTFPWMFYEQVNYSLNIRFFNFQQIENADWGIDWNGPVGQPDDQQQVNVPAAPTTLK